MHVINLAAAWTHFLSADGCSGWARLFGMPSNVVPPEQIWLVADGVSQRRIWLNGSRLGDETTFSSKVLVTGRLDRRNLLLVLSADVNPVEVIDWNAALLAGRWQVSRTPRPSELHRVALLIGEKLVDVKPTTVR